MTGSIHSPSYVRWHIATLWLVLAMAPVQTLDALPAEPGRETQGFSLKYSAPGIQTPAVETCVSICLAGRAAVWSGVFVKLRHRGFG